MSDIPTLNLNGPNEFVPDFDSFLAKTDDNTEVKTAKKPKTPAKTKKSVVVIDNQPRGDNVDIKAILDNVEKTELCNAINEHEDKPIKAKKDKVKKETTPKPIETDTDKQEQDEKHQNLLLILHRYTINDRFKDFLKEHGFDLKKMNLQKKSCSELEELINRVRLTVNSKHENGFIDSLIAGAVQGSETMITTMSRGKIDLRGLRNELYQNEEFLDLVEQLKLEHLSFVRIDPRLRLTMIVMQTAVRIASINKMTSNMHAVHPSAPIPTSAEQTNQASNQASNDQQPHQN